VKGEWLHSQREKREKLRVRNQEYLDKLKYMLSYRESKISEKIQQIERASSQRDHKLQQVFQYKEQKVKQRKDESQLRNVYFSIQK
jgi:hypothetical protein